MEAKIDRDFAASLSYEVIRPCPDGLSTIHCLACRRALDIHQPDPARPERMLGTCEACGHWHVIGCREADDSAIVTMLPHELAP